MHEDAKLQSRNFSGDLPKCSPSTSRDTERESILQEKLDKLVESNKVSQMIGRSSDSWVDTQNSDDEEDEIVFFSNILNNLYFDFGAKFVQLCRLLYCFCCQKNVCQGWRDYRH